MDNTTLQPAVLQSIPVDLLKPNPWNRTVFDPEAMKDLVASIKAVGVKERLIVRKVEPSSPTASGGGSMDSPPEAAGNDKVPCFQIASGHRRWLAAKEAGLKEVPCIVQDQTDEQVAEDDITINIQQEDIPPLELGRMLSDYLKQFSKNQRDTARIFGKTEGWVSQYVGYLAIHPDLRNFTAVKFSTGDLRALKQIPLDQQQMVAQELKSGSLTPEKLQKRCRQLKFSVSGSRAPLLPRSPAPSSPSAPADPLADIWPPILSNPAIGPESSWGVTYKGADTWSFWSKAPSPYSQEALVSWLRKLAEALEAVTTSSYAPSVPTAESIQNAQKGLIENFKPRLPQTPEEEKELQEIAIKGGPKAVYSWIYGADSFMTKAVPAATWEEMGMTPIDGLRRVLDGIRQFKESAG